MGCGSSTHDPASTPQAQQAQLPPHQQRQPHKESKQGEQGKEGQHQKGTSGGSSAAPASSSGKEKRPEKKKSKGSTEERYEILKVLGEGASCKVVSARDKATQQLYAMKIMDKSEAYNKVLWENETLILRTLRHGNILEWVESYEDKRTFHLLTVLCQGGELFDRVKNGSFSEKVAARLTKEMLQALQHCHASNVIHRDLKPENFVFDDHRDDSRMRLIDFGCAKVAGDDEVISDVAGSPYYVAPEILSESYVRTGRVWKAADMWSVGVILFLLVCGYPPFNGDSQERIFKKIKKGKFRFPKESESGGLQLSDSVKHLITELLQMHPKDRLTATDALAHPWIAGDVAPDLPLPSAVVDALGAFRSKMRLKKAVARVLAHHMTEDDKDNLAVVFKKFDTNGDGQLGADEIAELMRHIGKTDGELEVQKLMDAMDEDGDGGVSLDEFATHVTMGQLGKDRAQLKATFDAFDIDRDGSLDANELHRALGSHWSMPAILEMIQEADSDGDNRISFDEFLRAMGDVTVGRLLVPAKDSGTNSGVNAVNA